MRASSPAACTTPEAQCQAAQYLGGVPGTQSMLCAFDYDAEIKCESMEGVLGFHDFFLEDNGDIRVWRAYDIGPGKVYTSESLDKLYKNVEGQDARPSQGPTKCVLSAVAPFRSDDAGAATRGKPELSRKRKLGVLAAKDVRRRATAEAKRLKVAQEQELTRRVVEHNKPHACGSCPKRFCYPGGLRKHACRPQAPSTAPPPLQAQEAEPWTQPEGTSEASMRARSCAHTSRIPPPLKTNAVRTRQIPAHVFRDCPERETI